MQAANAAGMEEKMRNKTKNKLTALLAILLICVMGLAGCGKKETEQTGTPQETGDEAGREEISSPEQEETPEPEPAGDTAILVVSFGTSYNDSRDITIGAVEAAIADANPGYEVRRAFTAQIIIDKLRERDGLEIDNVTQALDRAAADGVKNLVIQPTHLMDGFEYNDLVKEVEEYEDLFESISVGSPLLTSDEDFKGVINAITAATKSYDDGETAIVFMGHGTEAESNEVYETLQEKLAAAGFGNYYIGTVEAEPALEDVVACLKENGSYKKVVLQPLMLVAGDHANNDMAGEEDSWKTVFENEGYEVTCILKGLGELPAVRDIYVAHAKAALESLAK